MGLSVIQSNNYLTVTRVKNSLLTYSITRAKHDCISKIGVCVCVCACVRVCGLRTTGRRDERAVQSLLASSLYFYKWSPGRNLAGSLLYEVTSMTGLSLWPMSFEMIRLFSK